MDIINEPDYLNIYYPFMKAIIGKELCEINNLILIQSFELLSNIFPIKYGDADVI